MKVDSGVFTIKEGKRIKTKKQLKASKVKTHKTIDDNAFKTIMCIVITILVCIIVITNSTPADITPELTIGGILEESTDMQQLYQKLALNVETMDIVSGIEGIREINKLVDIIEEYTGEKVCVSYDYDSFKEEGDKYTIKTSGISRRPHENIYTITCITIIDRETGETIYIKKGETRTGGTVVSPEYDYCMEINYSGFNYDVNSFRYDYEETTYKTVYEYEDENTVKADSIEKEYDNVLEVFNILIK